CRTAAAALIEGPAAGIKCLEPNSDSGTSKAVIVEDVPLIYTSQLLPLNQRGDLVGEGDAAKQTEQLLANLAQILTDAHTATNSGLANTVKLNFYVTEAKAIPLAQRTLSRQFTGPTKPAVSFVVGNLSRPDALVAMDAVATSSTQDASSRVYRVTYVAGLYEQKGPAHASVLPAGPKIYVSGMADTNNLPEATRKTLEKLIAAIRYLNLAKEDVVQLKAFLQPMSEVATVRKEFIN